MSETLSNAPSAPAPLTPAEIVEYLDYACEQLLARRDQLIASMQATLASHPRIDDDDALADISENMKMVTGLNRTAKDQFTDCKKPFLEGGRVVDKWFKDFSLPLDRAVLPVQIAMNDYGARKLVQQRAEAQAIRAKADAEAKRLADIAAAKLDQGKPADRALDRATDAAQVAEKAEARATARAADLTRSRGSYGSAVSVQETWKWRITDPSLIPLAYLMVDPDAIKLAAKPRDHAGKPLVVIPGIEFYAEARMAVR